MKARLKICLLVVAAGVFAPMSLLAQDVTGDWEGTLSAGPASLRLVFHFTRGADGVILGRLDSLDQGSTIPVDSVQIREDSIRVEARAVQGTYQGTISADRNTIKGTWTQGTPLPLELKRVSQPEAAAASPISSQETVAARLKATGVPIDLNVPTPPIPFAGHGGATNLVYELHMTNFAPMELRMDRIEVLNGNASLAVFEGAELDGILQPMGPGDPADKRAMRFGLRTVAFVWVRLAAGAAVPATLRNRITVNGFPVETILAVSTAKPVVVGSPLRGADWLAANGPSNTSIHRRALAPVDGRLQNAQRFAIDWVKRDAGGRTFAGDARDNKTYYAYGSEALAVADSTVVAVKDGIPENIPGINSRAVPITLETIGGNHVVLDLGGGRFAFYAHLQPGSLKVKAGDRVRRGQVLGLVGNSGNSTEPHLHFHVSDGASPLGSEGIPYLMDSFEVTGGASLGAKTNALPLAGAQVRFP